MHYSEQCQNRKLEIRLLADGIDRFDFDRAKARQRGNECFRVALRKAVIRSWYQNCKLEIRLLAGEFGRFDFDRAKIDLRRDPAKLGGVLRSGCSRVQLKPVRALRLDSTKVERQS